VHHRSARPLVYVLFAHGLESGPWGRKSLALRSAGHDVTAPDCRGLDLGARVAVLLETLRAADPVPVVVGSSFGGLAALLAAAWAAADGLVVPGLVLCAPALALPVPPHLSIEIEPRWPTLILHGRDDEVVPIEGSRDFARKHGVELVELDDDHSLARSLEPLLTAVESFTDAARPTPSGLGRAFEALLGVVVHDLRNPLGTVQLSAELARTGTADARTTRQAQRIVDNVARIVSVLDQAQKYASLLAQPRVAHEHGPTDASAAVAHVVQTLRPEDRMLVEVSVTGDAFGPWDAEILAWIVGELVDNALGYRTDEDAVKVRIDGSASDRLIVEVENSGVLSDAQRSELFVPYAARKMPRPHGTRRLGLGLVLARRWAEQLSARLAIDSSERHTIARLELPRPP
jgi:signal transduction histidine kinase